MGRKLNPVYREQLAEHLSKPRCCYCGRRGQLSGGSHRKCQLIAAKSPADLLSWYFRVEDYYDILQASEKPPRWAIGPVLHWVDEMCQEAEQRKRHKTLRDWWITPR